MTTLVLLQRAQHGSAFRAHRLHAADPAQLDPFMGIDHAWMSAPTFPPHPHAGFSAVTYLFPDSETGITNRDSLGHRNLIEPGGLHWTAAGHGVVHEENPAVTGRTTHLLQIFVNLPRNRQNTAPQALSLAPHEVPVLQRAGARVRVPLGGFGGVSSPLPAPTAVTLLDITLDAGAAIELPVPAGHRAFLMPIVGQAQLDGQGFGINESAACILPVTDQPSTHQLLAPGGGAQVAVFIGEPLRQPVFSNGPMAFASQPDLLAATAAYQRGDMGRL